MCRVTASETSPPPTSTGRLRKRSSFSSTASTSSSSSSLRSSASKRVSFCDKIKVYPFERLQSDLISEVFYAPEDYRRFRSDCCLELLDQQASPDTAFKAICKKLFGAIAQKSRLNHQKRKQQQAVDYPWLKPYHPHEEPSSSSPQQQEQHANPTLAASKSKEDTELERKLIEELAFLRT